ncbi:MAG TPA: hypothetical protein VID93_07115 [Acidimicrobiales bacterium]|jgi:hypothetical protein
MSTPGPERISRDDIEASLRGIQTGVGGKVRSQQAKIARGVGVAAVVIVLLVFLIGKRSGRKRSTIVEIRRV